ncbi:hypothetical protein E9531_16160 [Lampropedia puyangensis]|uniref:DNA-3-methyladenine glycosylase II n=1 Tax=Lampropedia puyangensis TaxID=1330072 RepID=A0A4S8EP34_9BURK|nr:DNA-3-methyladenine glycosylase [Lampropedia puyangensis]THT96427.1 hypothetical protein E9531_16160 [Lampropedia puyangensis]
MAAVRPKVKPVEQAATPVKKTVRAKAATPTVVKKAAGKALAAEKKSAKQDAKSIDAASAVKASGATSVRKRSGRTVVADEQIESVKKPVAPKSATAKKSVATKTATRKMAKTAVQPVSLTIEAVESEPVVKKRAAVKSVGISGVDISPAKLARQKVSATKAVEVKKPATAVLKKTVVDAEAAGKSKQTDSTVIAESVSPEYWEEACRYLIKKDRILRKIIPKYSGMGLQSRGDAFSTLARSIVGQQISTSAAAAVWSRVEQSVRGKFTAAKVLALDEASLRASGLSMRKAEYLRDLALHVQEGRLNVKAWQKADDEAIIAELTAVRGIGRWTAEMFLMFHLMRPNVLPLDDLGLIQGISRNYFSGEPVSRSDAREVAEGWKPWRTVATWYMWRSLAQPQAY